MDLSDDEIRTLIEYARRKFAEERYPLDPALEPASRSAVIFAIKSSADCARLRPSNSSAEANARLDFVGSGWAEGAGRLAWQRN